MKILGRLRLWQKLAVLVTALAAPMTVLGLFYFEQARDSVQMAHREFEGAQFLRALNAVLAELLNHRGRVHALLSGDETRRDPVLASEAALEGLIASVEAEDAHFGAAFGTSVKWQSFKSGWSALKSGLAGSSPADSLKRHAALVRTIFELNEAISVRSGLALDSNIRTHYLIKILTELLPLATDKAAGVRMRATGAALLGRVTADDRVRIEIYDEEATIALASLGAEISVAAEAVKTSVMPPFIVAQAEYQRYIETVRTQVLQTERIAVTGKQVYEDGSKTTHAFMLLSDIVSAALVAELEGRVAQESADRLKSLVLIGGVLAFAFLVCLVITRTMTKPMAHAIGVFQAISAGKYDNRIERHGTDEAAQVLGALQVMQDKMKEQLERERAVAAENKSQLEAINRVQIVVEFRLDGTIVDANENFHAAFGYTPAEVRGRHHRILLDPAERTSEAYRQLWHKLCRGKYDFGQYCRIAKDGREVWLQAFYNPVLDAQGKPLKIIEYSTNMTTQVLLTRHMQQAVSETQQVITAAAAGDLTHQLNTASRIGDLRAMSEGVNALLATMTHIIRGIKIAASEVHRRAEEISSGNLDLSRRTEQQAAALEETAASMEEMTSTVRQNADNAHQANEIAAGARHLAEEGVKVIRNAVHAMAGIDESSRKIADIVGIIDEIAFQTNLLALNAAVEAARAGERGNGFAVVAGEVRSLAGRVAVAAREIKELIHDSVTRIENGSALVAHSGQSLEQVVTSIGKVSAIVAEIAAASREQSAGIEQVNGAVMQMDESTQQNAALVEQVTVASAAMVTQARELNGRMEHYRLAAVAQDAMNDGEAVELEAGAYETPARQPAAAIPARGGDSIREAGRSRGFSRDKMSRRPARP